MCRDHAIMLSDLEDRMRLLVRRRIVAGEITGAELARRAGIPQAQLSTFLNRRQCLDIETMDCVMQVLQLDVQELMPQPRRDYISSPSDDAAFEAVPRIKPGALLHGTLERYDIVESVRFRRRFLRHVHAKMATDRSSWTRFVLVKASKALGMAMRPRVMPGALLLIDRHYNSLRNYRPDVPNLYAVSSGAHWQVCYVAMRGGRVMLRTDQLAPEVIEGASAEQFAHRIAGRVVHISMEI